MQKKLVPVQRVAKCSSLWICIVVNTRVVITYKPLIKLHGYPMATYCCFYMTI